MQRQRPSALGGSSGVRGFSLSALLFLLVACWWLLVQTEGVYLGARVVRWLYDRSAHEYDEIKEFDEEADDRHLGQPLSEWLAGDDISAVG